MAAALVPPPEEARRHFGGAARRRSTGGLGDALEMLAGAVEGGEYLLRLELHLLARAVLERGDARSKRGDLADGNLGLGKREVAVSPAKRDGFQPPRLGLQTRCGLLGQHEGQ